MIETHTHNICIILLAFPRKQLLRERALMLRYTTMPGLFNFNMGHPIVLYVHNKVIKNVKHKYLVDKLLCCHKSWRYAFQLDLH
jgi:hypothetical protein